VAALDWRWDAELACWVLAWSGMSGMQRGSIVVDRADWTVFRLLPAQNWGAGQREGGATCKASAAGGCGLKMRDSEPLKAGRQVARRPLQAPSRDKKGVEDEGSDIV
jgi:hypothetical protein